MKRRRLVGLVGLIALATLMVLAFAAIMVVTRTDYGRNRVIRQIIATFLGGKATHGSVYIGKVSGSIIGDITIDSLAVRDAKGELFFSTGRVSATYDPRDVIDYRIWVRHLRIDHPYVHLRQHENGEWNYKRVFASQNKTQPATPTVSTRGWGNYFVLDSVQARGGTFILSLPWHPDDSLRGARRDSSVRMHLASTEHIVQKTDDGYARVYTWNNIVGAVTHARLADPDSDKQFGKLINIGQLRVDERDPPFNFRNASGVVRQLGDTVTFRASHFDLPASTGTASGRVTWGSDLPVRYDITVQGDSVALDDVNWVYATLPRTGGGKMVLRIKNDPANLQIINYRLTQMDVRSTSSHLTGEMTFGVGAPVLQVRDVDLRADPVDFDLLRTLAGKPFPYDWQGHLTGTVKGRGGPLTNFVVNDARAVYQDKHVPGAVSRFTAKGELDMLVPAFTVFHGLDVDVAALDLRTIEYVNRNFPKIGGIVSGTARLDSSWLDVRFSNAHIVHQDGPGEPSRVSGNGRVTNGEKVMTYDMTLDAQPLSFTMLSRSLPWIPIRGLMSGPLRVKGIPSDLEVVTSLQGPAGSISFEGRVDADSIGGMGARGHGDFSGVSIAQMLEKVGVPPGTVSGHYEVDLTGENLATLTGVADIQIERTIFDNVRVYPSHARVRFAEGRAIVDSLRLHTAAATVEVRGAIGLPKGRSDTLHIEITADSLGGLRRYLSAADTALARAVAVVDSLAGNIRISATATGKVDSLDITGRITGSNLTIRSTTGQQLSGTFNLKAVLADSVWRPTGTIAIRLDSVRVAGVAFDTLGVALRISDLAHADFTVGVASGNGWTLASGGNVERTAGGTAQLVRVDSLNLLVGKDGWRLARPTTFFHDSLRLRLDTLILHNADSGVVVVAADVPRVGQASAQLTARNVPLKEGAVLAHVDTVVAGLADVIIVATGTKTDPLIDATATLRDAMLSGAKIDRIGMTGRYAARQLTAGLDVIRGGRAVIRANAAMPANMPLLGAPTIGDSVNASIVADSADLAMIEPLIKGMQDAKGSIFADVRIVGPWTNARGHLSLANGSATIPALGIVANQISASVGLFGDSVAVNDVRVASEGGLGASSLAVRGSIAGISFKRLDQARLNLTITANGFHALDRRSLARADVTTTRELRFTGTFQSPALSGGLRVDRGALFLPDPELLRKRLTGFVDDSTAFTGRSGGALSSFVKNLQLDNVTVDLGEDVRLRSREANVKLRGSLRVINASGSVPQFGAGGLGAGDALKGLALEGTLTTDGGTYTLDLGLARREFAVLQGGTVTFDGLPDVNPEIDIKAQYNVKQYKRPDIGVIVNVRGRLFPTPVLLLTSDQSFEISPSDLVSYLITGQPGFYGGAGTAQTQAVSFFAPTASVLATSLLRRGGSFFDAFNVNFASPDETALASKRSFLYWTTVDYQYQIRGNLFLSANAGLCTFETDPFSAQSSLKLLQNTTMKLDYRVKPTLSIQAAREPSKLDRLCTQQVSLPGFINTPGQFSFSLFHTLRW